MQSGKMTTSVRLAFAVGVAPCSSYKDNSIETKSSTREHISVSVHSPPWHVRHKSEPCPTHFFGRRRAFEASVSYCGRKAKNHVFREHSVQVVSEIPSTEQTTAVSEIDTLQKTVETSLEVLVSSPKSPRNEANVVEEEVLQVVGGHRLSGHVRISGAKNSGLAILAGAILCHEQLRICNMPKLGDIARMCMILTALGCKVSRGEGLDGDHDCLYVDASTLREQSVPANIAGQLRASFFVIGPLLARLGEVEVPLPGGCDIGMRPVELHLRGLQAMGAQVELKHGVVHATVQGKLKGASIFLDYPSVGATETIMMAATLADGETIIQNAAREPEVVDLANFCIAMGAKIQGAGTDTITVVGVDHLHSVDYSIIPDRIEVGTMLCAAAITKSELTMGPVIPEHLSALIAKLEEIGCKITNETPDILKIVPGRKNVATDVKTMPYPGFPTDLQAQFMAVLSVCEGVGIIHETVFENRMRHAAEMARMGAQIKLENNIAIVTGGPLSGARVTATDLRASASLVLAGLAAEGTTVIHKLHHLDRGYDQFDVKLRKLGAVINRITVEENPSDR